MKLINTDGMAFIGPGSEWFWMALSGVVLAITFLAIYRQLRAQRSASVFEQMTAWNREYDDVRFTREKLVFLLDMEGREVKDGLSVRQLHQRLAWSHACLGALVRRPSAPYCPPIVAV